MKSFVAALVAIALAVGPSSAQNRGQGTRSGERRPAPAARAPQIFRGGPRGPMTWNDFHHDTAQARLAPHRLQGTVLPRPNSWRGNFRNFDLNMWRGGRWQHIVHAGRLGWWWVVGPSWYFFDAPVYPYPDLYTPYGEPIGWWYWCDAYQEYYPYVTSCPVPWESVVTRE